jgi:hypothetical protein
VRLYVDACLAGFVPPAPPVVNAPISTKTLSYFWNALADLREHFARHLSQIGERWVTFSERCGCEISIGIFAILDF